MQQPVCAREYLHKRAEIDQPHHLAQIGLPDLGHGRNVAHHLRRLRGGGLVGRVNVDRAVILDVDLHAGLLHDASDHLPARSDQLADLVGRNRQRVDARSVRRERRTRLRDHRFHFAQQEQTPA